MTKEVVVAYDIDFLGLCHYNPHERTGIHRVVENLAEGLLHNPDCHLLLYAQEYLNDVIDYMKTDQRFNQRQLFADAADDVSLSYHINSWVKKRISKVLKHYYEGKGPYMQLAKFYRMLPFTINGIMPKSASSLKRLDEVLKQANVYHSPYSKITDHVSSFTHLKHFLTVYDLIPIIYPEYVVSKSTSWTKTAIDSLNRNNWVFAISEATKNDLCNYSKNVNPDQVIVTYLGASQDKFYPCNDQRLINAMKEKYKIPKDAVYFLGLSNLAPHKNFEGLIKGFYTLVRQEKLSNVYLVVVGKRGQGYENILAHASIEEKLQERVIFTGRVEDEDLAALYSGALSFTFMSFYEGFGLPPLEAMQCGVPVITSNTSSLPEVVGDAGITVNPKDEDALCQAMLRVYQDNNLRAEMAKKSLIRAASFSWDACVKQTVKGYRTALNA